MSYDSEDANVDVVKIMGTLGSFPDPHAFYGTVTINDDPAPVGTQVEARGEGVITRIEGNPVVTTEVGQYGSADPLGAKMIVWGDIPDGTTLTFYVNEVSTGQTLPWHSGDVTQLDLAVTMPIEVFNDSFEDCSLVNWVQDTQEDWFCSEQRVVEGTYSAEVDGRATDATLTLKDAINLSIMSEATLTFSWFIESGLDSGEYLALDLWNGTAWVEAARLSGNIDQENVWHNEEIDLGAYLISDFKLRFRGYMSYSSEDANVDVVKIMGTLQP